MTQTHDKTLEFLDTIKKAQLAAMSEVAHNIMLGHIVFKTGRTTRETQEDYLKSNIENFRNQIAAAAFCALSAILLKEGLSPEAKVAASILIDLAQDELSKSNDKLNNLREHLHKDHIQELSNELAKQRAQRCPK